MTCRPTGRARSRNRAELDDLVDEVESLRPVRDQQDRAVVGRRRGCRARAARRSRRRGARSARRARAPAHRRAAPARPSGAGAGRRRAARPPRRRACRARRGATRPTRRGGRGRARPRARRRWRSGRARARFARMVELKTCAFWPAIANVRRTSCWRSSRTSRPADRHPASLRVEEAQQQIRDRRLAGAARPDERDPPARLQPEVEAGQRRRLARRIAGGHALERDGRRELGHGTRPGRVPDRRLAVDQLEHAPAGRERGRELDRGRPQRQDALERREREQRDRRHEHPVDATRLAATASTPATVRPAIRIDSPSASPAASASRRPSRTSSSLRVRMPASVSSSRP